MVASRQNQPCLRVFRSPERHVRFSAVTPVTACHKGGNCMATTATATMPASTATAAPDLAALKTRQQAAWSSGNYAIVGSTLQIVGEQLCEALDLKAGSKVLDVAAGNGMASLAAARRWCDVTSTDYVPALLERGQARAASEGWQIEFREAD